MPRGSVPVLVFNCIDAAGVVVRAGSDGIWGVVQPASRAASKNRGRYDKRGIFISELFLVRGRDPNVGWKDLIQQPLTLLGACNASNLQINLVRYGPHSRDLRSIRNGFTRILRLKYKARERYDTQIHADLNVTRIELRVVGECVSNR